MKKKRQYIICVGTSVEIKGSYMKSAGLLFTNVWENAWHNNSCGGGIVRGVENLEKTSVINEIAVQISSELGGKFLNTSKTIWNWLEMSGLINENDIVADYMDEKCKIVQNTRRTHRQA